MWCMCTASAGSFRGIRADTYFAMILPGIATLTVCDLPPVGVNTAVGFVVCSSPLVTPLAVPLGRSSELSFRFYSRVRVRAMDETEVSDVPSSPLIRTCLYQSIGDVPHRSMCICKKCVSVRQTRAPPARKSRGWLWTWRDFLSLNRRSTTELACFCLRVQRDL